ncbi:MAG TPA: hypothetical protein VFB42_08465 [Gaiellaceae bacterium]|nr:hypothetical protein [Gaiellaceae bacterium]
MNDAALEAVGRAVEEGGDADDVLRAVVGALVRDGGCSWAGILFAEEGAFVLGPEAGSPDPGLRLQVPVVYGDDHVAELVVDGCADGELLERVAALIAAHCLVGWDTGGKPWRP